MHQQVDIDISANSVANYVTGMVRGTTTSLDVDLAFVLEGEGVGSDREVGGMKGMKSRCFNM